MLIAFSSCIPGVQRRLVNMHLLMVTNKVKTYAFGFQTILNLLNDLGHTVVWAADFSAFVGDKSSIPCKVKQISINTNPLNPCNFRAYKQLIEIIEEYNVEGIVCSTPIGGTLARLAAKKKKISHVLYEAHGFLFFKGAPFINRTLYKWAELYLAHYTDVLITITDEDFRAAKRMHLRDNSKPYYVHGAGIKVGVNVSVDKSEKRKSLGLPEDAFIIVSAGELNRNKNTQIIVKSLQKLKDVHYIACGVGPEKENLEKLANKLGVSDRFHMLGYRTDIAEIMSCADAFTIMSFREGLPRALMEAMDLGLPCVGSDTRGIRDLIDANGGYICKTTYVDDYVRAFNELRNTPELCEKMGEYNRNKVKKYSVDIVKNELRCIYVNTFNMKGVE